MSTIEQYKEFKSVLCFKKIGVLLVLCWLVNNMSAPGRSPGQAGCAIEHEAIPFKIFATNSVNIGLYMDLIQSGLPTYDLD